MGSAMGKQLKRALAVVLAVCMVLGLNPASALAQTDGAIRNIDTGEKQESRATDGMNWEENGSGVSTESSQLSAGGDQVSTTVSVKVISNFKATITNAAPVQIESEPLLEQDAHKADYTINAQLTSGVPNSNNEYTYKWVVYEMNGGVQAQTAIFESTEFAATADASKNASVALWLNDANVKDASGKTVKDILDFGNASAAPTYNFYLVAKDSTGYAVTSNSQTVVCGATFEFQKMTDAGSNASVSAWTYRGGATLKATDIIPSQNGGNATIYNELLNTADGDEITTALDLAITNQLAVDDKAPQAISTINEVRILANTSAQKDKIRVWHIVQNGGNTSVVPVNSFDLDNGSVVITDANTLSAGVGVFAVSVASEKKVAVSAIAATKVDSSAGYNFPDVGGKVTPSGKINYAPGTKVQYTFLPFSGYELARVDVLQGTAGSVIESYAPAAQQGSGLQALPGLNYLDFTVPTLGNEYTIAAYFKATTAAQGKLINVSVGAGEEDATGTVTVISGEMSQTADSTNTESNPKGVYSTLSGVATFQFNGVSGSVLDYVEVDLNGTGKQRANVVGDTLTLTGINNTTSVVAHFRYGTQITYPNHTVTVTNNYIPQTTATDAGVSVGPASSTVVHGGSKIISIEGNQNTYYLAKLTVDGVAVTPSMTAAGSYIITDVLADVDVQADFRLVQQTRDIVVTGGANGTVSGTGVTMDSSGANGTVTYLHDRDVVITAAPNNGYEAIVKVNGATDGVVAGANNSFTIAGSALEDASAKIEIEFKDKGDKPIENPVTAIFTIEGDSSYGTVAVQGKSLTSASSLQERTVEFTTSTIDFTATPKASDEDSNNYYSYSVVVKCGADILNPTNGTYSIPADKVKAENGAITVTFTRASSPKPPAPITYQLRGKVETTANFSGTGTINPANATYTSNSADAGVLFTITPEDGTQGQKSKLANVAVSSGANSSLPVLTWTGGDVQLNAQSANGAAYTYMLGRALITQGYDTVTAFFSEDHTGEKLTAKVSFAAGTSTDQQAWMLNPASGDDIFTSQGKLVNYGGSLSFTFKPGTGYVTYMTVNGVRTQVGETHTIMGITSDQEILIEFKQSDYSDPTDQKEYFDIWVSSEGDGSIDPAGTPDATGKNRVQVAENGNQAFTFQPGAGMQLSQLIVDGNPVGIELNSVGEYVFGNVQQSHSIHAVFAAAPNNNLTKYTLEAVTQGGVNGGTLSNSGNVYASAKQPAQVTVSPNSGFVIGAVLIDGREQALSGANSVLSGSVYGATLQLPFTGTGDVHAVVVRFVPDDTRVSVHTQVLGAGGTISPSGSSLIAAGKEQTFTMKPDEGYTADFMRQVDANGNVIANLSLDSAFSHTMKITAETWIECAFKEDGNSKPPVSYPVTIKGSEGGSVSPSGNQFVGADSSITITATPNAGYKVGQVLVGSRDITQQMSGSTINISGSLIAELSSGSAAVDVKVMFEPVKSTKVEINLSSTNGGTISPSGKYNATIGETLNLTFVPENATSDMMKEIQITYLGDDGTTEVQTIPAKNQYSYSLVVTDRIVGVHAVFDKRSADAPAAKLRSATVSIASGCESMGRIIQPASGTAQVAEGDFLQISAEPANGYKVQGITLNGASITTKPGNVFFVNYNTLSDGSNNLVVSFAPIAPKEVPVWVQVSTKNVSAWPENTTVPYYTADENIFLFYPAAGYVVTRLQASLDGGSNLIDLDFEQISHGEFMNNIANLKSMRSGGLVNNVRSAENVGATLGAQAQSKAATNEQSIRYYKTGLQYVDATSVELIPTVEPIGNKEDNALGTQGELTNASLFVTGGSVLGAASPMRVPVGSDIPMNLQPDEGKTISYISLHYNDGSRKILQDNNVNDGAFVLDGKYTTSDLAAVYVVFKTRPVLANTTPVEIIVNGQGGAVSPGEGVFDAIIDKPQTFTFTYDNDKAYIAELKVNGTKVFIDKFAQSYTYPNVDSNFTSLEVTFAQGGAASPSNATWQDPQTPGNFYTVVGVSDAGGSVRPSSISVQGDKLASQAFTFRANDGYMLTGAEVRSGSANGNVVKTYTLDELRSMGNCLVLSGISQNLWVRGIFVVDEFTVDVTVGEGGTVARDGREVSATLSVPAGEKLLLTERADEGYTFDGFRTEGYMISYDGVAEAPQMMALDNSEARGVDAEARATEVHSFTVGASGGRIIASFNEKKDDPIINPPTPGVECVVDASSSGHGSITPSGKHTYAAGTRVEFTLTPESSQWQADSITLTSKGQTQTLKPTTPTSFVLTVESDCTVVANFSALAPAGSNSAPAKALRHLTSLAQTGDLTVPGILVLTGVACAALGVALLTNGRGRRRKSYGKHA
ncbi:hypothetical protein [Adlercreutzia sp. ZJ154]|uniref:InlB B-repeat-containing protein n=1 Tax=Adlercreutzia sp. ZJ154 TaxID=2709790 RepID=UPI0013EB6A76|nr:hypothetical protein [Adlercreutzia sp. ZJ154]